MGLAETILIVNAANPVEKISSAEVSNIYLGKVTQWPGGLKVQAVDQKKSSPAGMAFLASIMKMSEANYKKFWVEKMLSGEAEPITIKNTDVEIFEWVKSNTGGIGYIDAASPHAGVKVLPVDGKSNW